MPEKHLSTEKISLPMKSKAFHRFYEPLVALCALNFVTKHTAQPLHNDLNTNPKDNKQLFQTFVYKLAHLCDSVKGGNAATITSFAVLKDPGQSQQVHYRFASNQRTNEELEATATYVRELLARVNDLSADIRNLPVVINSLLAYVLGFNRPRVRYYLRQMKHNLDECLVQLGEPALGEDEIADSLEDILEAITLALAKNAPETEFVNSCLDALGLIESTQTSEVGKFLEARARESRDMLGVPSKELWSNLQHMINRTLAYKQSVKYILYAKKKWPELFRNPKVSFILSSKSIPAPKREASCEAKGIINRMAGKLQPEVVEAYKMRSLELQKFGLDGRIRHQYETTNWNLIVHSEVLLLDQLLQEEYLKPERFFGGWMYIGSSKQACKLCDYYFAAFSKVHGQKVECRQTHGNMYMNWRVPDVYTDQGAVARQKICQNILEKVREEAFALIQKRSSSTYKANDSNTFSARLSTRKWDGSEVDVAGLTWSMRNL